MRASLANIQSSTGLSYEDIALALCQQSQTGRTLAESSANLELHGGSKQKSRKDRSQSHSNEDRSSKRADRKSRSERAQERENIPMDTYKLEVGREHSVRVGDILGAVANELGIESRYIGEITLEDSQSRIELPKDMPKDLFQEFRKIRIRSYPAKPELVGAGAKKERNSNANAKPESSEERKPRKRSIDKSKFDKSKSRAGNDSRSDSRPVVNKRAEKKQGAKKQGTRKPQSRKTTKNKPGKKNRRRD